MGADLVVQQRLDPVRPEGGGLRDEQTAERHHQLGDVVPHLDADREVRVHGAVALELRTGRVGERPGRDGPSAGRLRGDGLK